MWVSGVRDSVVYTVKKRPLDPRWSNRDLQTALGWCALGQHLGWSEDRAFQAAEGLVMKKKNEGIVWPSSALTESMDVLESLTYREETT